VQAGLGLVEGGRAAQNPLTAMLRGMAGGRRGAAGHRQGQPEAQDLKSRVAGMLDKERA